MLSPGEGGPSCGKSRRQLSGLSTEPGCRRLLVQACTGWLGCLPSACKMGAEELSSLNNADRGENAPCLGHKPKWVWYIEGIVAWSIPGMSGRSLGSDRQGQDLARSIGGDLGVNWGPLCVGTTSSKSQCALMWK